MTHHPTLPDFGKKQWSFGQFKVWVQPQMPSFLLYKPANCLSFPIVGLIDWTMQCLYPAWKCRIYEFCDGIWNSIITEKGSHWGPKGDTLLEKCSRHVTRNNVWSSIPKSLKPRTVNWKWRKEVGRGDDHGNFGLKCHLERLMSKKTIMTSPILCFYMKFCSWI